MFRTTSVVALLLASIVGLCSTSALAVVAPTVEFVVGDAGAAVGSPPARPEFDSVLISRGKGPQPVDESCEVYTSSSGDNRGAVVLTPLQVEDESGPLGFRLRLLRGVLPGSLSLPSYPIAPHSSGQIFLTFGDPKETRTQPFDFTLSVTAVRRDGAESEPTEVMAAHDGSVDSSVPECDDCSVVAGRGSDEAPWDLAWLAVGLSLAVLRRAQVRFATRRPRA